MTSPRHNRPRPAGPTTERAGTAHVRGMQLILLFERLRVLHERLIESADIAGVLYDAITAPQHETLFSAVASGSSGG